MTVRNFTSENFKEWILGENCFKSLETELAQTNIGSCKFYPSLQVSSRRFSFPVVTAALACIFSHNEKNQEVFFSRISSRQAAYLFQRMWQERREGTCTVAHRAHCIFLLHSSRGPNTNSHSPSDFLFEEKTSARQRRGIRLLNVVITALQHICCGGYCCDPLLFT